MDEDTEPLHRTWIHIDGPLQRRFVRPAMSFMSTEASGAIVLLAATIAALVWANSAWGDSYFEFWEIHIEISIWGFHFD